MTLFDKWLAVVLTTFNPLTGRGVAIPLGIGFGLPVLWVCIASGTSNFIAASVVVLFVDRFEHIPRVKQFIEKKRGRRLAKFIESKGLPFAVILGPLVLGTFTVVLVFQALGADKKRMLLYSLISAVILTPAIAWLSPVLLHLLRDYENLLRAFITGRQ